MEDWHTYVLQMPESLEKLVRPVIWKRREAYYKEAVKRGIITNEQRCQLMALHLERDTKQDAADIGPPVVP